MPLTSRRTVMGRKRYKPQEIVAKLRQVDVLVSQGQNMVDATSLIVERRSASTRSRFSSPFVTVTFQLGDEVALAGNVFFARRNMFLCLREVALEHFLCPSGQGTLKS